MVNITHKIDEVMEIEELFILLGINYDDSTNITDGEIVYNLFSFSNLDDNMIEILLEMGFQRFKENIFFIDTKEVKISCILTHLLPIYQKTEAELWDNLVDRMVSINGKRLIFKPTSKQLKIASSWKGKLTQTEDEFKSFINDLCLLFRESCKDRNKFCIDTKCQSHSFWKTIGNLRNFYFFHDTEHWGEKKYKKATANSNAAFECLFNASSIKKTPVAFMKAQSKLIDECLDFLEVIEDDLNE